MKRARHIELAEAALQGYQAEAGGYDGDSQTLVADLLGDLQHWSEEHGVDWQQAVADGDRYHATDHEDPDATDYPEAGG